MWYEQSTLVLVDEDRVFPRSADHSALFFNRSYASAPATQPFFALQRNSPSWTFFQDPFVSVYPVIEAFSAQGLTPQSRVQTQYYRPPNRFPEPEDEYSRFNHGVYFSIVRLYAAQLVGYVVDVPDFNDDPWNEWVHPPQSPEAALFPFRQVPQFIRGQQFNLFFDQPKPWRIEAEEDSVFRRPDVGVLLPYGRPMPTPFLMPNLIGLLEDAALTIIFNDNLTFLGAVYEDTIYPTPPIRRGTVIGQWPLPGTLVIPLQDVILILASGLMFLPGVDVSVRNPPNTVIGSTKFP